MARCKLFISYSHQDSDWLERLKLHLAPLERLELVHVWADTKIRAGDRWTTEIENALSESRAAILMITPGFMASQFIWEVEMPHILAHSEAGMQVFPLITKPCAWRIEPRISSFQARPANGRALSVSAEPEVDSDLSDFVYELAELLGRWTSDATIPTVRESTIPPRKIAAESPFAGAQCSGGHRWLNLNKAWSGVYAATGRSMRITFRTVDSAGIVSGTIDYAGDGTTTEINGRILNRAEIQQDNFLKRILDERQTMDGVITFRETAEIRTGVRSVDLHGEYRAVIYGNQMSGFWIAGGGDPKHFTFTCDR
jgi:hypothetical protein